jgi:hypothetical protein
MGRSNTDDVQLNTVVFTPMPNASVTIATALKPGAFNSWRSAKWRSFI